jgi:hypothetical protein
LSWCAWFTPHGMCRTCSPVSTSREQSIGSPHRFLDGEGAGQGATAQGALTGAADCRAARRQAPGNMQELATLSGRSQPNVSRS